MRRRKENFWRDDRDRKFRINPQIVTSYFDRTQCLNFDDESAEKEKEVLLPFINLSLESKVLDLGCGNGRWGEILIDRCGKYLGTDISKKFIRAARRRIQSEKATFICMPAQNYIVEEQYDLILVIGLITYMNDKDIVTLSDNCKAMLKAGGSLILRNVTLSDNSVQRRVFDSTPPVIKRLLGRGNRYQIIRRSMEEELSFFKQFHLLHTQRIEGTAYRFYVFE